MSQLLVFVFSALTCATIPTFSLNLPSYIEACNTKNPNFQKCALEKANSAIPHIANGDKQYQVPVLSPLVLPFVQVENNNFKINFTNLEVSGLQTAKLTSIEFLEDKLSLKFRAEHLQLFGDYAALGRILIEMAGAGKTNITAVGGDYSFVTKLSTEERNGESFLKLGESALNFKFERIYFWLENMMSSEKLGIDINKILNENWQDVYGDLGQGIEKTVEVIYKQVVSGIFKKVPKKHILP